MPTFIPATALGRDGRPAPSERITMGVVGWGMQGPGNTNELLGLKDCQVVAACDMDKNHLQAGGRHHQRPLQEQGLQGLPRLPRDDGAQGH